MPADVPVTTNDYNTAAVNSGTSITLNKPINTSDGDALVAAIWGRSLTGDFPTAPSGWQIRIPSGTRTTSQGYVAFYTKPIPSASAETATSYTWSGGATGRINGEIVRVTGANLSDLIDSISIDSTALAGTPQTLPIQAVSPTRSDSLYMSVECTQTGTGVAVATFQQPTGYTKIADVSTSTASQNDTLGMSFKKLSASGSNGVVTYSASSTIQSGIGYAIAIKSAFVHTNPTLAITGNQNVATSASVSATVTPTLYDGATVSSYSWTVDPSSTATPTLTGASSATVSFTAPSSTGNLVILKCTVTDSMSGTATATTEVRVPVDGGTDTAPIISGGVSGTWNNVGGAASIAAALADSSDTTYAESGSVSSTAQTHRDRFFPGSSRSSLSLTRRLSTDTGTATATLRLYEGGSGTIGSGTLRATWTQAVTSTITDYTFAATSTQVSNIVDWGALWTELDATT